MISPREQARREAIIALENKPPEYSRIVELGDYELAIAIDTYTVIPPSGRCRQVCETPEEFYGETILEYRIVRIWGVGTGRPNDVGSNLELPPELSESALETLILELLRSEEF